MPTNEKTQLESVNINGHKEVISLSEDEKNIFDGLRGLNQKADLSDLLKKKADIVANQYETDKNIVDNAAKVASVSNDINTKIDVMLGFIGPRDKAAYIDLVKKYKEKFQNLMSKFKKTSEFDGEKAGAILGDLKLLNSNVDLWANKIPNPEELFRVLASNIAFIERKFGYTEETIKKDIISMHSADIPLGFNVEDVSMDVMSGTLSAAVGYQINKDVKLSASSTIQSRQDINKGIGVNNIAAGVSFAFGAPKDDKQQITERESGANFGKVAGTPVDTMDKNPKEVKPTQTTEKSMIASMVEGMKTLSFEQRNTINKHIGEVIQKYEVYSVKLTSQSHKNEIANRIAQMKEDLSKVSGDFTKMQDLITATSNDLIKKVNAWYKEDAQQRAIKDPSKRKKLNNVELRKDITSESVSEYLGSLQESTTVASIEKNREVETKLLDFKADQLNKMTDHLKQLGDQGGAASTFLQKFFGANDIGMTTSTVEFFRRFMETDKQSLSVRSELEKATGLKTIEDAKNARLTTEYVLALLIPVLDRWVRYGSKNNTRLINDIKLNNVHIGGKIAGGLDILGAVIGSMEFGNSKMQLFLSEDTMKLMLAGAEATEKMENPSTSPEEKAKYSKQLQNMLDMLSLKNGATFAENNKPDVVKAYESYLKERDIVKQFISEPKNDEQSKITKKAELDKSAEAFKAKYGIDVSQTGDYKNMLNDTKFDETSKKAARDAEIAVASSLSKEAKDYLSSKLLNKLDQKKEDKTKENRGQLQALARKSYKEVLGDEYAENIALKMNLEQLQAAIKEKGYNEEFAKNVLKIMSTDDYAWSKTLKKGDLSAVDTVARQIIERMKPNQVVEFITFKTNERQTKLALELLAELDTAKTLDDKKKIAIQAYAIFKGTENGVDKTFDKVSQQRRADKSLTKLVGVLKDTDTSASNLQTEYSDYQQSLANVLDAKNDTLGDGKSKLLKQFIKGAALIEDIRTNINKMADGNFTFVKENTPNYNLRAYANEGKTFIAKYDLKALRDKIQIAKTNDELVKVQKDLGALVKDYDKVDALLKAKNQKGLDKQTELATELRDYLGFSDEEMKKLPSEDMFYSLDSINAKLSILGVKNAQLSVLSLLPRVKGGLGDFNKRKDIVEMLSKRMEIFEILLSKLTMSGHNKLLMDRELADILIKLGLKKQDVYKSNNSAGSYSTLEIIEASAINEQFKKNIKMPKASNVDVADMLNVMHGLLGDRSMSRQLDNTKIDGKTIDFKSDKTFLSSVMNALSNPRNAELFKKGDQKNAISKNAKEVGAFFSEKDMMAALSRLERVTDPKEIQDAINSGLNFDWKGEDLSKDTNYGGGMSRLADKIFKTTLTKSMMNGDVYEYDVYFKKECVNVQLNPASKVRMLKQLYDRIAASKDWGAYNQSMPELKFTVGSLDDDKMNLVTFITRHDIIVPAYVYSLLGLAFGVPTPPMEKVKPKCDPTDPKGECYDPKWKITIIPGGPEDKTTEENTGNGSGTNSEKKTNTNGGDGNGSSTIEKKKPVPKLEEITQMRDQKIEDALKKDMMKIEKVEVTQGGKTVVKEIITQNGVEIDAEKQKNMFKVIDKFRGEVVDEYYKRVGLTQTGGEALKNAQLSALKEDVFGVENPNNQPALAKDTRGSWFKNVVSDITSAFQGRSTGNDYANSTNTVTSLNNVPKKK